MAFRDSKFVQNEVAVINQLQDQLSEMTLAFPAMTADEREEYVEIVENLLERQRILWTRVELSKNDDETAAMMSNEVRRTMVPLVSPKTCL